MSGSIDGETHKIYRVVVTYCLENDTDTVDIQKFLDTYQDRVPLEALTAGLQALKRIGYLSFNRQGDTATITSSGFEYLPGAFGINNYEKYLETVENRLQRISSGFEFTSEDLMKLVDTFPNKGWHIGNVSPLTLLLVAKVFDRRRHLNITKIEGNNFTAVKR